MISYFHLNVANTIYRWSKLRLQEAEAIAKYLRETRKSDNRAERNFLMCKRIIESLCILDWTLPEIAESQTQLLGVLGRYVDLDALSKGQIRSTQEVLDHENSQGEHLGGSQAHSSTGRRHLSTPAEQQGGNAELPLPREAGYGALSPFGDFNLGDGTSILLDPELDILVFGEGAVIDFDAPVL